jgi:hypothetical protein
LVGEYIETSLSFFRSARIEFTQLLTDAAKAGNKWILLIGAEINAYFEDKLRKLQNAAIEHFMENKETNKEAGK